jgi:hypothetical protein
MQIQEIFGEHATQDANILSVDINDLPVRDKSKPQHLLAGIVFNLLNIPASNEFEVTVYPPRFINQGKTRYMAITIKMRQIE